MPEPVKGYAYQAILIKEPPEMPPARVTAWTFFPYLGNNKGPLCYTLYITNPLLCLKQGVCVAPNGSLLI